MFGFFFSLLIVLIVMFVICTALNDIANSRQNFITRKFAESCMRVWVLLALCWFVGASLAFVMLFTL